MFKNNSSGFYTSLFIENKIKLYEESGKVNYRTNNVFRKIFRTHFVRPCRNHSSEQKINHKNKSGTECTALQRVLAICPFSRINNYLKITFFIDFFSSTESF